MPYKEAQEKKVDADGQHGAGTAEAALLNKAGLIPVLCFVFLH